MKASKIEDAKEVEKLKNCVTMLQTVFDMTDPDIFYKCLVNVVINLSIESEVEKTDFFRTQEAIWTAIEEGIKNGEV